MLLDKRENPSWYADHLPALSESGLDEVCAVVRSFLSETRHCFSPDTDEKLLWNYLDIHGLGGIAGYMGMNGLLDDGYVSEQGFGRYMSNVLHHSKALNSARKIGAICSQMNIPLIVLKGPSLSENIYSDTGLRSYSDIDVYSDSAASAKKIISGLSGTFLSRPKTMHHFFGDAVKIDAKIDKLIYEFSYPVKFSGDPGAEYVGKNFFEIADYSGNILCMVDPVIYACYLILHMASGHFYSRLIWMTDIVMLARKFGEVFDYESLSRNLRDCGFLNSGHAVTKFCRDHLWNGMQVIPRAGSIFRMDFHYRCTEIRNIIERKYSLEHSQKSKILYNYFIISLKYFILSDSGLASVFKAGIWTAGRISNPLGLHCAFFVYSAAVALLLPFAAAARAFLIVSRILGKKREK